MDDIYAISASNAHRPILAKGSGTWPEISGWLNRKPASRTGMAFEFGSDPVFPQLTPEIACIYISGALAFPEELKALLFPGNDPSFEWVPINVSGKRWLLLNCLNWCSQIQEPDSEVFRGLNGNIIFVKSLFVARRWKPGPGPFALAGSNCAQLFVTQEFRDVVADLKLGGVTFNKVGRFI